MPKMKPATSSYDTQTENRDQLLDFAKGVAIIFVVIGHTLQGVTYNFDENWAFRVIYSFHMPLFALLAGASAAFWINKYDLSSPAKELTLTSFERIKKSADYLLIPFLSWSLISHIKSSHKESIKDYAWKISTQPDYSLWFLPCIFWCTTYAALILIPIGISKNTANAHNFKKIGQALGSTTTIGLLMFLTWKLASPKLPTIAGLVFANSFHGGLFFFFLLSISCFHIFSRTEYSAARIAPYIVFISLAPFWHRTLPHNLIEQAPQLLTGT
jgi:fucose 4-O-acetylase-like acetyltransferase